MELTYATYLGVDDLLALQRPRSEPEQHDEMLFIVIHQVYELWFKLLLHETGKLNRDLDSRELWGAVSTLQRMRHVLKTLVGQLDVLETMTPMSFAAFRDRLDTASGFQSVQFRELEFALGYKRPEMLKYHPKGSEGRARLERRLQEPAVMEHVYGFLRSLGVDLPGDSPEALQDGLYRAYRDRRDLAVLLELLIDLDEGMQEWRYRHVKLVERTIGNKLGTGGSLGVEFLKASLFQPLFPDLWAMRHRL